MQAIGADGSHPARLMAETQLSRHDVTLLLIALEDAGMVGLDRSDSKEDVVEARLTTAGHDRLIDEERRLDDIFEHTLSVLSSTQRRRLLYAMRQVVRILRAASIEIRIGDPHHPDFALCLNAYFAELAERYGGFDPDITRPIAPEQMVAPAGLLVMAYLHDLPVGCGAVSFGPNGIGAIKRMWVSRDFRGLGIGSRILSELERLARDYGAEVLRLENRHELYEATEMYRQFGYREVDPFNDEFYADRWYEKTLASENVGRTLPDLKRPVPNDDSGAASQLG